MLTNTCLSGLIVLDLGQLHPGPHTALLLGQLGATVIKVERPDVGDTARTLGTDTFAKYNRGKRSIALDLKNEQDKAILLRLVKRSHALIEGFRPGVMARLDLGFDELKEVNPALVMCSISGFGQTGPYAQRPGHDLNYLALAGYWAVPSQLEDVIGRPRVRLSDYCGSMYAALSLVVAMMTARQTGQGQHLDVSLHDAMMAWTVPGIDVMERHTGKDTSQMGHVMPDNDLFVTADGRYIALGILEEKFWENLRAKLQAGFPEIMSSSYDTRASRMAHKPDLSRLLKRIFSSKTLADWEEQFLGADIPFSPVLEYDEVLNDPHVVMRGMFSRQEDSASIAVGFPVKFSNGLPKQSRQVPGLDSSRQDIINWLDGTGEDEP